MDPHTTASPSRSWAYFFLYAFRRIVPLVLVVYVLARYHAWRDPVVITLLLMWVLAILSFRAALHRALRPLPRANPSPAATRTAA